MRHASEPLRRAVAFTALMAAAAASMATSAPNMQTTIEGPVASGVLTVDADHPIAVQRVTVSVNDVAYAASGRVSVYFSRAGGSAIRITVVPVRSAAGQGLSGVPAGGSDGALEIPSDSPVSFELDCQSPCERSFRVFAQALGTAAAGAAISSGSVAWSVKGSLVYTGSIWPSGAGMSFRVDPPIAVGGAGRSLSADIPNEEITLDATHPAAVRLVEVRLAASAVPSSPSDVVSNAVLQVSFGPSVSGGDPANSYYGVSLRQVSPVPPGAGQVPSLPQFDPFIGCEPGGDCVRTYLLTARGLGSKPETIDWSLHLSQIRLTGDAASPGSMHVTVMRSFDITADPPRRLHFEGDLTVTPGDGDSRSSSTEVAVAVAPVDPTAAWPVPYDMVPVPGVARLETTLAPGATLAPRLIRYQRLTSTWLPYNSGGDLSPIVGSPFADQHPDLASPLRFQVLAGVDQRDAALTAPTTIHWTLDMDVYTFDGLPQIAAAAVPVPTPLP
jgi:hypothetical protein